MDVGTARPQRRQKHRAKRVFTVKGEQGTKQVPRPALVGTELGWFGPNQPLVLGLSRPWCGVGIQAGLNITLHAGRLLHWYCEGRVEVNLS